MSNEKTNEDPSWKARMDQLDSMPGEDGDWKEAAWDQLYARLHEKEEGAEGLYKEEGAGSLYNEEGAGSLNKEGQQSVRKRVGWYWAAACLAFAGAIALWLLWPGGRLPSGESSVGQLPVLSSADSPAKTRAERERAASWKEEGWTTHHIDARTNGVAEPGPGSIHTRRAGRGAVELSGRGPVGSSLKGSVGSSLVRLSPVHPLPDMSSDRTRGTDVSGSRGQFPAISDTPLLAGVAPPIVQRKLRVVYINELVGPAAEDPRVNQVAGRTLFAMSDTVTGINQLFTISFKN